MFSSLFCSVKADDRVFERDTKTLEVGAVLPLGPEDALPEIRRRRCRWISKSLVGPFAYDDDR